MLSKSDEEILTDRLRNWGRWAATGRHARSTIIYRMMVQAGEIKIEPSEPHRQIDIFDALLVDRAWRMLPQRPVRYWIAKWALVAHYAFPWMSVRSFFDWVRHETRIQCGHEVRINSKDYDILLETAKYQMFNLINQNAAKRLTVCDL